MPQTPPPAPAAPSTGRLETNIGLTLVNRIGVITLVIGVGFFFKWAVDNQWIGPTGRVILGLVAGLLILFVGDRLWHRDQKIFAQGVTGTGISILYLSLYAAFSFYHLLSAPLAFTSMVSVTLMAAALALRYDSIAISALGMFGGYLTPVLLSTGQDHPWVLFIYVLLLDLGALSLARFRGWTLLNIFAFLATAVLYFSWFSARFEAGKELVATVFDLVYYALFAPTLSAPVFLFPQILTSLALVAIWPAKPGMYFLFSLLVAFGGLVLAQFRRSAEMVVTTFVTTWLCFAIWHSISEKPLPLGALFVGVTLTFALFLLWVLWWILRRQPARTAELTVVALNGMAYFGASYGLLNPDYHAWLGLFAVVVACIHLGMAYLLWNAPQADRNAVLLALGFAFAYLTLAIPIQFTGYRITMAWAVEGAALTWIGTRLTHEKVRWGGLVVFWLMAVRLTLLDAWILPDPAAYPVLWNARFVTFAISAAALWLASWWDRQHRTAIIYYVAGHVVLLSGLTLDDLAWAARNSAPANLVSAQSVSVSLLWAVYGLVLVALGVGARFALNRLLGLLLIGVVVLKLYVWDVWQLARVFRILCFVALGILLLATSYLYSRYRTAIEGWWKNDAAGS